MRKQAYLINSIEEYGKLISMCIEFDISVWRTFWDERECGTRCYHIDWQEKRCYYSSRQFYEDNGYDIVIPVFDVDKWGIYKIVQ